MVCFSLLITSGSTAQLACNVVTTPGSLLCTANTLYCYSQNCGFLNPEAFPLSLIFPTKSSYAGWFFVTTYIHTYLYIVRLKMLSPYFLNIAKIQVFTKIFSTSQFCWFGKIDNFVPLVVLNNVCSVYCAEEVVFSLVRLPPSIVCKHNWNLLTYVLSFTNLKNTRKYIN